MLPSEEQRTVQTPHGTVPSQHLPHGGGGVNLHLSAPFVKAKKSTAVLLSCPPPASLPNAPPVDTTASPAVEGRFVPKQPPTPPPSHPPSQSVNSRGGCCPPSSPQLLSRAPAAPIVTRSDSAGAQKKKKEHTKASSAAASIRALSDAARPPAS